jgi:DNA (cytosine-5)-methyltransferase 1
MTYFNCSEFSQLCHQTGLSSEDLSKKLGVSARTLARYGKGESIPRPPVVECLKNIARKSLNQKLAYNFEFIDLFAGIGGMRRGFDAIGGKCIFTSEWNKYAQQTYLANFPHNDDHIMAGDITKVNEADIPNHDVLLAGFPCQPFSIAGVSKKNALGKKHGFSCETQGTLFFDVARIIEYHRPGAFLLENVKNLVNHNQGKTFRIIHDVLKNDLGYHLQWKVINAKCLVPQHRERIFIAGFRGETSFSFDDIDLNDPLYGPKLKSILHPEDGSEQPEGHFTEGSRASVSSKYTLTDHLWQYLQDYAEKHRKKGNGFGYGLFGPDDIARTLSARYYKDGSEILIRQENLNPRRLTPRECSRIMGFDKPSESSFKIVVSDTQAYRQFGNAVVVPVVEAIARHMAPWILKQDEAVQYAQRETRLYG